MAVEGIEAGADRATVGTDRATVGTDREERGWIARWISADPVRAVAVALIVIQIAWRANITSRGYLAVDDFVLASRAAGSELTTDFLFGMWINHLMPGAKLIYWLSTEKFGLAYWPYVVLLITCQAMISVAFYRLLRQLVRPGWGLLIPLCILLFSPLTLEATSWWVVGVNVLPMQLAMVLAIGAQVKYVRTRRLRHLATLPLSILFGLSFYEKSLLIVPLVFLMTACFFVTGGPFRSILRAARQYWQSWLVLTVLVVGYFGFYLYLADSSSLRMPRSVGEVLNFNSQMIGSNVAPGLLGGPWRWTFVGDAPPIADPPDILRWLAWVALLALVVITARMRPVALRAWVLLGLYVVMVAGLLSATRLGAVLSGLAGLVPRYVGDVVVVGALCIGVALLGLNERKDEQLARSPLWPAALREPGVVAVGLVAAFVALATLAIGTLWSTARFSDAWAVKEGREYLRTAQAELRAAPPGTVFIDQAVPETVLPGFFWPDNLQSSFFRPLSHQPVFVTEAEHPSVFDDKGHIRLAEVAGFKIREGSVEGCGNLVDKGKPTHMPLDGWANNWPWVAYVGYVSSGDSVATIRLGDATHRFAVRKGLHQIFFVIQGEGSGVELTVDDPDVALCTRAITIGHLVPRTN